MTKKSQRRGRGMEWDQLVSNAREGVKGIPPEEENRDPNTPSNEQMAGWANAALRTYVQEVGVDLCETAVQDLLSDLAHWCDRHGVELWDTWVDAGDRYREETNGKGGQFDAK